MPKDTSPKPNLPNVKDNLPKIIRQNVPESIFGKMSFGKLSRIHIFQPVALEAQGSLGESSEIFITRVCKMLCPSHDNPRAGSFLNQRISLAFQIGKASCVLGTVSDRGLFEEIFYI